MALLAGLGFRHASRTPDDAELLLGHARLRDRERLEPALREND